jgi:ABC-type dipeptide/oligopeptide/nickel transport system permease subunit
MSHWMDTFTDSAFYQNWFSNVIPVLVVVALFWTLVQARKQPIWAEAYRRLGRNGRAKGAIALICLFGAVALSDSIGWKDNINADRLTLLDRAFHDFKTTQERTYSRPLGTVTVGEPKPHKLVYPGRHLLGTDANGQDVLYQTLRGCRTAFIVGGLTQLIATPLALFFGMCAGYFGKRVDDAVQYVYTVLDSIPTILLLIALVLVLGRGLTNICIALGITSWVGLCRLARGETLKHRDREYVRAARALGVSNARILTRHILPNLLPLIIISVTLGISGQILGETILSYLGVGVDSGTGSWGNMIDAARQELTRDPVIWWTLGSAAVATFALVLSFNILGDALRDSVDPRLRS